MSEIQIFYNPAFGEIRTAIDKAGEPLFCLADVCKALDITNVSNVKQRLSGKGVHSVDTLTNGGIQAMIFVNEANLYKCVFQSRKPYAEAFQDWVCDEVLPAIRKTGSYSVMKEPLSPAEALLVQVQLMVDHERKLKQLQTNVSAVEKRLDDLDAEREENTKLLNAVELSDESAPAISMRNHVRKLVNQYATKKNVKHQQVWDKIYEQLYYIYGISIRARKRKNGETLMDVAERIGCVEKMYAIISDMIKEM